MNDKKPVKGKASKEVEESAVASAIVTKTDLKNFLLNIRDKMTEQTAAPIYAATAMNQVLNMPEVYELLDKTNKEIARDIWLRLKQAGMQVRNPPMLFSADEDVAVDGL
jgi:hypothetical protein